MSDFVSVAKVSDFPECGKLCLEVDDYFLVVVKLGDDFFCLDDVCTHDGGPLGEGPLLDNCLVCPRHGAKFDVRTGDAVEMPATEPTATYPVRLAGDDIQVQLP